MSCPICGKARPAEGFEAKYRPFCGKRCADIDLGRWLNEDYRVPAQPEDDSTEVESLDPTLERPRRPI